MNEVIVASAVRTAIGDFGGALKDVPPCDLGATVIRAALERAGVKGDEVGHVRSATSSTPNRAICTCRAWPP